MESPLSGRDTTGRLPHSFILPCRPSAKLPLGGTLAEGGKGAMSPFPPPRQLSSDIFNRASGTSRALKFLPHQRQCDSSILIFPYSLYHWESKYSGSWCVRPVMYLDTPPITGSHSISPPPSTSVSFRSFLLPLPLSGPPPLFILSLSLSLSLSLLYHDNMYKAFGRL